MSVSNIFIEDILYDETFFKGVFSSDEHVSQLKNNDSVIFNLSKRCESGSHFVSIYRKANKLIYFDPLCLFLLPNSIARFINKHNLPINYNSTRIQSPFSDFCGYFCIAFILLIKAISFNQFLNMFYMDDDMLFMNDVTVLKIIYKSMMIDK
jgi:hypothetical protein